MLKSDVREKRRWSSRSVNEEAPVLILSCTPTHVQNLNNNKNKQRLFFPFIKESQSRISLMVGGCFYLMQYLKSGVVVGSFSIE